MVIRVAVIGCGAAGLGALRNLSARLSVFEPVGFEMMPHVGGTWKFTEDVGTDRNGLPVHSSMYKNLKTNIPKEVMQYPDYPFPSNLPSFIHHEAVQEYLENYCAHYQLSQYINFETKVDSVTPVGEEWRVSYRKVDTSGQQETRLFDAILVCNGHYSVPLIPQLEGMDEFKGRVIHSHSYKDPGEYRDQIVVCLGGGASGQDISLDIATVAKQVILSHDKPVLQSSLPPNVSQQVGIAKLTADSAIFKNGEEVKFDTLLLSTGYRYSFPFLSEDCSPTIIDERMTPLFKHIVHAHYPTLFFIGMCKIICPFPQFDSQAKFILSILDGSQKLPSTEEMKADIEEDYQKRLKEGLPRRHAHLMGPRQWAYNDDLAKLGNFTPVIPAIQQLYNEVHRTRVKDLMHYKEKCYNLVGKDSYEETDNKMQQVEA